jgi:integrase
MEHAMGRQAGLRIYAESMLFQDDLYGEPETSRDRMEFIRTHPPRGRGYQRDMKDLLKRAGILWHGWHGFRRGLASNLNRLGVDDSVIQRILRHSTVATTQNHYIKTASPDAIAAMKQFSEALLCSTCAPEGDVKAKGSVQ